MTETPKAQQTRTRLLDAAEAEFSEHGPAGARVDRIAELSGVNKQRIYAYFGNKEALFSAVLTRAQSRMAEQVPIPTTESGLRAYAGEVFDYHRRSDELVRLLAWEGLHYRDRPIPDEKQRETHYLRKTVALGIALGIDDATASGRALIALIGLASWPFVVPQQRRLILGPDSDTEAGWALLRESVVAQAQAVIDLALAAGTTRGGAARA